MFTNVLISLSLTLAALGDVPPAAVSEAMAAPASSAPAGFEQRGVAPVLYAWAPDVEIEAWQEASPIDLSTLPPSDPGDPAAVPARIPRKEIRSPLSEEEMARLREAALRLPFDPFVQEMTTGPTPTAPTPHASFASIHYGEATGSTPPDPELAVGPNHVIAVVNTHFKIHDKSGTVLAGPTSFGTFFTGTTGYPGGPFDPVVSYDDSQDRWVMGVDANGTSFCLAATTGPDPTSTWNRYCFATNIGGAFFDYPHMGIGEIGVFVGSNQFGGAGFLEGRTFAVNKANLYAGSPLGTVPSKSTTASHSTPWPAAIHGYRQDQWPVGTNSHYIVTELFDGCIHNVWTWTDPFGAGGGTMTMAPSLNLCTATGVSAGMPVEAPQSGGSNIQSNDFRTQSTHYRAGKLWINQTISCNPGGGTVNCVRWAKIDPVANTVLDAGVFGSSGEYRSFPSLAVNFCGDMAIGYSKTSAAMFPATLVTGRAAGDAAGTLQAEVALKAGDITFTCFDSVPRRWGDYTGFTADPDGTRLWYLGQYSRDTGAAACRWGTWIGSYSFPGCQLIFANSFETNGASLWSSCTGCS